MPQLLGALKSRSCQPITLFRLRLIRRCVLRRFEADASAVMSILALRPVLDEVEESKIIVEVRHRFTNQLTWPLSVAATQPSLSNCK